LAIDPIGDVARGEDASNARSSAEWLDLEVAVRVHLELTLE
jgi:hypothetical protein